MIQWLRCRSVARSEFERGAFPTEWDFLRDNLEKKDFFQCFLGKSGLFWVLFCEKVDFYANVLGESGLIHGLSERKLHHLCISFFFFFFEKSSSRRVQGYVPWENYEKYD